MDLQFEWDEYKAARNWRKHGVAFEEAISAFDDIRSIVIHDEHHSNAEDRFILVGRSHGGNVLVVVYTERDDHIRIISCRKATSTERRQYEQQDH